MELEVRHGDAGVQVLSWLVVEVVASGVIMVRRVVVHAIIAPVVAY